MTSHAINAPRATFHNVTADQLDSVIAEYEDALATSSRCPYGLHRRTVERWLRMARAERGRRHD